MSVDSAWEQRKNRNQNYDNIFTNRTASMIAPTVQNNAVGPVKTTNIVAGFGSITSEMVVILAGIPTPNVTARADIKNALLPYFIFSFDFVGRILLSM